MRQTMDQQSKPLTKSLPPNDAFERAAKARGFQQIAGVDEAGRGPLAGPVVAAACILSPGFSLEGIDDSKKLTPKKRAALFEALLIDPYISYGIGIVEAPRIDEINILQATFEAMLLAVENLKKQCIPDYLLIDGSLLPPQATLPAEAIVSGDAKSLSIAAASVLAKETRDRLMLEHDLTWPYYHFKQHKGYPTKKHLEAIALHGPSPIHRLSFTPFTLPK